MGGLGDSIQISIQYEDSEVEDCYWPDEGIVIVGKALVEEKKAEKTKSVVEDKTGGKEMDKIEIGRDKLDERMFSINNQSIITYLINPPPLQYQPLNP